MRYIILGGPKTGKTTLGIRMSQKLGLPLYQTDSLIASHDWSESSQEVAHWIMTKPACIIEGVATARALRKVPDLALVDVTIVRLTDTKVFTTIGQVAMGKGVETVWNEIAGRMRSLGVDVLCRAEAEALCAK